MSYEIIERPERTIPTAYVLWLFGFIGLAGIHRFYVGRPIGQAQLELMGEGVITLDQFGATTLCHEAQDGGRGWYRDHHTHMHVATR